jgi:Tol biopolymer transport system component
VTAYRLTPFADRVYVLSGGRLDVATRRHGLQAHIAPGGKLIAFDAGRSVPHLDIVRADGTGRHRVATERCLQIQPCGLTFAWARDGRRLAVVLADRGSPRLRILAPSGRILSDVKLPATLHPTQFTVTSYFGLTWSPDGRWIGLERGNGFDETGYFLMHPDGAGRRELIRTHEMHDSPAVSWAPDSKRLAFATDGRLPSDPRFAVVDVASGTLHRLNLASYTWPPAWSPDSQRLLVAGRDGIQVATASGEILRTIPGHAFSPVWAPDGKSIAFIGRSGVVLTIPARGGEAHVAARLPRGWHASTLEWAQR